MFSDTDIVDAPGRVEPADTARDQPGTVCSVEINILLERRGELSTLIYTYLDISTQYLRVRDNSDMARGTETLFDIQRKHGAACSQEVAGGHPGSLNKGITSDLGGGHQELLAIRSPHYLLFLSSFYFDQKHIWVYFGHYRIYKLNQF